MALSLFSRNHSVETDRTIKPTYDELVIRVTHLAAVVSTLSAQVTELQRTKGEHSQATNGPIPTSAGAATSGRSLMRLIGTRIGKNEDSVRKLLVTSPRFQAVRDASAKSGLPITRNMDFLRYLADNTAMLTSAS